MKKDFWVRTCTIILSIIILFLGNKYVSENLDIFKNAANETAMGKITKIINREETVFTMQDSDEMKNIDITFNCQIISGKYKGLTVEVLQNIDPMLPANVREVRLGDRVIVINMVDAMSGQTVWHFAYYSKLGGILILTAIFLLLMFLLLRKRGFNIIVSLAITCAAIFFIFIPAVLNGYNIYMYSILVCLFITISTLIILNGWSRKTLATIIGCFTGVISAGIITVIMDKALMLTGMIDEHSIYLQMMNPENPINLRAIVFASIIIGALGAVMDVAMDIASSSYEISLHNKNLSRRKLLNSSLQIGRDIMGTMSNTLILAYIGSSLTSILLMITYAGSTMELLNRETVVVEILQALIGSTAIVLTIPITAIVCSILYVHRNKRDLDNLDYEIEENKEENELKKKSVLICEDADGEEIYKF